MDRPIGLILKGYVRIEISGDLCERFLNLCAYHDVYLWDIVPVHSSGGAALSYRANLTVKDLKHIKEIRRKCHVKIRIYRRVGLPFFVFRNRKRSVYLVGIAAAFVLIFCLSAHIWNIQIDGNMSQTDDVILEYLEQEHIVHGMKKSNVDCRELAENIRNYFGCFSWVSVQLEGTCLYVRVKEIPANTSNNGRLNESSIQAAAAGEIISIYVRNGSPLVEKGDHVEPGMVMVSGLIPIKDDSGAIVSWQRVQSDADIVIAHSINYKEEISRENTGKIYTGKESKKTGVQIGGTVFALRHSFTEFDSYDIVTKLKQWKILEHFYLPIYWRCYLMREYKKVPSVLSVQEAEEILTSNLEYFIKKLEEKGLQIFENDVKIECNEMSAAASGTIYVGDPAYRQAAIGHAEEELLKNEYG